jgi:hypothetical protein
MISDREDVLCNRGPGGSDAGAAGVAAYRLACGEQTTDTLQVFARRWGEDRALSPRTVDRLVMLLRVAVEGGLRFQPREVVATLQWIDVDEICIELRWNGCRSAVQCATPENELGSTAVALNVLTEKWTFATHRSDPLLRMVVHSR